MEIESQQIPETKFLDRFPVLSKALSVKKAESWLEKILWGLYFSPMALLAGCVDLILFVAIKIIGGVKYAVKKIFDTIVEKFIGIIFTITAIAISTFFLYFFLKTGLWKNLFDFCCGLFA